MSTPTSRRHLLKGAGLAAAAGTLAAPAIAQSAPKVRWRLTSSYPKSLDTIYGSAVLLSKYVGEATDGQFQIDVFAPGELVPGLQAFDAVQNGTVEAAQTALYYYIGKNPAFAPFTTLPFGLNARMQTAWLYHGGGTQLQNAFLAKYNVIGFAGGNTGAQMGGWFRKEIKSVADIKGLKMRIPGIAGQVLSRLGLVPQNLAGGDIYPALEKGTIDAAEFVGPVDDEKLGFVRVAPYYYYPGWWEGGPTIHFVAGNKAWDALPKAYKAAFEAASAYANADMLAKYDAGNPAALRRLVAQGAQLRPFPMEVMDAAYKENIALMGQISAQNADFKAIYDSMLNFRNESYLWWQVGEYPYDGYMIRARTRT
ncbi:TRAP transporter substrate-binding protein [Ancylobacter sp. A5.8]|uniref:TRAP transporter substrate-binding protein n=1 Tax=Ancylobacter gelatini TaxID=2919920 RepID=UPI001F4E7684|nr:TRAP transporter substrate-binding protein [Ancylobacter gelatini]MCJ8142097.1 TRAP transporter substrate-binding protein [Ancylobacter gelatini]